MHFGRTAALIAAAVLAIGGCAATAQRPSSAGASNPPASSTAAPPPATSARTLLVENARAMMGQPYRYGGAQPGGFDCSGLVVYAAARAGITLPRTAQEQLQAGMAVAREAIQPGDLVFLRLAHKELHVGIAIDRHRFVHAPSHGRAVRIDSLDAPPYLLGYLGARRIAVDVPSR